MVQWNVIIRDPGNRHLLRRFQCWKTQDELLSEINDTLRDYDIPEIRIMDLKYLCSNCTPTRTIADLREYIEIKKLKGKRVYDRETRSFEFVEAR